MQLLASTVMSSKEIHFNCYTFKYYIYIYIYIYFKFPTVHHLGREGEKRKELFNKLERPHWR